MAEPDTIDQLSAGLEEVLSSAFDGQPVRVEGVELRSGGASRETWSFDALVGADPGTRHELILQRTRGLIEGVTGPPMAVEDVLLREAEAAGVPVPPVVLDSDGVAPLGIGRITSRIEGETLGRRIVSDPAYAGARVRLIDQCAAALAAIHSVDPARVPGLKALDPLARLRGGLDLLGERRPAFELALRWLADHRPPANADAVVHGDFRMGNLIVDETGLRAVLDWELSHLGDPIEDLGWFCVRSWRFGGDGAAGGVGSVDALVDAYVAAGGVPTDAETVRWWTVVGTLTWGLICGVQARRHLDGQVRSVELATVGRRMAETEYDLMQLLGVAPGEADGPAAPPESEADSGVGIHGRPTAAELVDAVRDHLVERVAPQLSGTAAFHLRVAANTLAIVERELRLAPEIEARHAARLDAIGCADEGALADGLRDGSIEADPAVLAAIRAAVVDRVRVTNPRWLEGPDSD